MHSDDIVVVVVIKPLNAEDIRPRATSGRRRHHWSAVLWPPTGVGTSRHDRATPKNEFFRQFQTGVMLDRQVVGVVAASGSVARVVSATSAPHSSVDLRRLEQWLGCNVDVVAGRAGRQLDEEEELVENIETTATDVTTRVVTHVAKHWLNCVTICVAFNIADKLPRTACVH